MSSETTEKTQLLKGETKVNGAYDSITSDVTFQPIIYCVHGKEERKCCKSDQTNSRPPHCHTINRADIGVDKTAKRKLIIACILCCLFMIVEIVGGFLANSLAIATDAAHLLTDLAGFLISLFSLQLATRPASYGMSFGWHRAEVIGALTSVVLIWIITGILCYMAVQRIIAKDYEIDAQIMVITATIGVIVNLIMGFTLHGSHGHSHGHNHTNHENHNDLEQNRGNKNINVRAALIHIIGDFFQSIGVLIAALIIYFIPEWGIVDPICTFLFSVLVLIVTFNIIKDVLNVLMEGTPNEVNFAQVQQTLFDIPGVIKVHNLRIWSLSLDKTALSAHLAIAKGQNPTKILQMASQEISDKFNIYELTLQVEEYREEMSDCQKCQNPES